MTRTWHTGHARCFRVVCASKATKGLPTLTPFPTPLSSHSLRHTSFTTMVHLLVMHSGCPQTAIAHCIALSTVLRDLML